MEFNKILKKYRKDNKLTQKECAQQMGVPFRTYQNWELGYNKPNKLTCKYILNYIWGSKLQEATKGVIKWQKH